MDHNIDAAAMPFMTLRKASKGWGEQDAPTQGTAGLLLCALVQAMHRPFHPKAFQSSSVTSRGIGGSE